MEGEDIENALAAQNWTRLRELSLRPGGFGRLRKDVWPFLLHVDVEANFNPVNGDTQRSSEDSLDGHESIYQEAEIDTIPGIPHDDERQVSLDTDRSFIIYPEAQPDEKHLLQEGLRTLVVTILRKRPSLHYFQGYHDILSVLFLTVPKNLQLACAEKLSLHRVRDAMGKGLEPLIGQLQILRNLMRLIDPKYAAILEECSPLPYFALANLLTLFSHNVPTLPQIQHVFDYLLCREPLAAVYLAAQIILEKRDEALSLVQDGEDGLLHSTLSNWPLLEDPSSSFSASSSPDHAVYDASESKSDRIFEGKEGLSLNEGTEPSTSSEALARLLAKTDELRSMFPSSHPSLHLQSIVGPYSVISTWSQVASSLQSDDAAEKLVEKPELVVYPYNPTPVSNEKSTQKRQTKKVEKSALIESKLVVAGVVVIVGVAVALYTLQEPGAGRKNWIWNRMANSVRKIVGHELEETSMLKSWWQRQ